MKKIIFFFTLIQFVSSFLFISCVPQTPSKMDKDFLAGMQTSSGIVATFTSSVESITSDDEVTINIAINKVVYDFDGSVFTFQNGNFVSLSKLDSQNYSLILKPHLTGDLSVSLSKNRLFDQENKTNSENKTFTLKFDTTPAKISLSGVSADTKQVGDTFTLKVTIQNSLGTKIRSFRGVVALTSSDSLATLPAAHPFTESDSGEYTFTGLAFNTAGSQTVTATISNTQVSAISESIPVISTIPKSITKISGDGQSGVAGAALGTPLVVSVKGITDNPILGAAVTWRVASGGGTFPSAATTSTSTTNGAGQATASTWTLGTTAGANSVSAEVSANGSTLLTTFSATGLVGTPTSISIFSGNNQGGVVGLALGSNLVCLVKDSNNNVVSNVGVDWAVTSGGGSFASAAQTLTDSNGKATSSAWTIGTSTSVVQSSSATMTIGGVPIAVTFYATPTVGSLSLANSTITATPNAIVKGEISQLKFTAKDSYNNFITSGGLSVSFTPSSGASISSGTLSVTTDNSNGTYTANFTATSKGTPTTIRPFITGYGSSTPVATLSVINAVPTVTMLTLRAFPLDGANPPLVQGTPVTLATFSDADAADTPSFAGCTFQSIDLPTADYNYIPPSTVCSPVPTQNGGSVTYVPPTNLRGTFQFQISVSDSFVTPTPQSGYASIRPNFTTQNLFSYIDAVFASYGSGVLASKPAIPYSSGATTKTWHNLKSGSDSHPLFHSNFSSSNLWSGNGALGTPYALQLKGDGGTTDHLDMGSSLGSYNSIGIALWVIPTATATASSVIIGNGGGQTLQGFTLRQSVNPVGKVDAIVGSRFYKYQDLILSDKPIGYWSLGEGGGGTASDLSATQNDGSYSAGATLGNTGFRNSIGDSSTSTLFNGSSGSVTLTSTVQFNSSNFSLEGWFKTGTSGSSQQIWSSGYNGGNESVEILVDTTNLLKFYVKDSGGTSISLTSAATVSNGSWHYFAAVRSSNTFYLYLDSNAAVSTTSALGDVDVAAAIPVIGNGEASLNTRWFQGNLQDIAIYSYALTSTKISNHYQAGVTANAILYPGSSILSDNPIGYWRLGETFGATAYDYSSSGNHGLYIEGMAQGSPSVLGTAGDTDTSSHFDGSSGYISIPDSSVYNFSKYSIEGWIKVDAISANQTVIGQFGGGGGGNASYTIELLSTRYLRFGNHDGTSTSYLTDNTTQLALSTWYHVVAVYLGGTSGTNAKLYLNGSLIKSGTISASTQNSSYFLGLGRAAAMGANQYFQGNLDEVAIYDYPLSSTQIASHYNGGVGANWWYCQSKSSFSSVNWNYLSFLYDGVNSQLYVDGERECSLQMDLTPVATPYSSASSSNVYVGGDPTPSSASLWAGKISSLKLFGAAASGAPVMSSTAIAQDYSLESNYFGINLSGGHVTSGLILHYDAAKAKNKTSPWPNGCAGTDLVWSDLTTNGYNGTLTNYSSCNMLSGWVGHGKPSSPYSLASKGSGITHVAIPDNASLRFQGNFTIELWIKFYDISQSSKYVLSRGNYSTLLYGYAGSNIEFFGSPFGGTDPRPGSQIAISDTNWHHIVYSYQAGTWSGYRDGNQIFSTSRNFTLNNSAANILLGSCNAANCNISGEISIFRIYSRGIDTSEVKQNCLAEQSRFDVSNCSL